MNLTSIKLLELLSKQNTAFKIASPGLGENLINLLISLSKNIRGIEVALPIEIDGFRTGLGEFNGLDILAEKVTLYNSPNLRLGLFVNTHESYVFFLQSLYIEDGSQLQAIKITVEDGNKLWNELLEGKANINKEPKIDQQILPQGLVKIDELTNLTTETIKNPQLVPDLYRKEKVFSHKLEIVELAFEGVNLPNKRITIPKEILANVDQAFKIRLTINLQYFSASDQILFSKELNEIKNEIEELRKIYIVSLKTIHKSVILVANKIAFQSSITEIESKLSKTKKKLLDMVTLNRINIYNNIVKEIQNQFDANGLDIIKQNELLGKLGKEINLDKLSSEIKKISIKLLYMNLTYSSLNNDPILKELVSLKLIEKPNFNKATDQWEVIGIKK